MTTCAIEEELDVIAPQVRWFELPSDSIMFFLSQGLCAADEVPAFV